MSPSRQVRRECGQGKDYVRPVGCGEAGAEAQTLIQSPCWAVLGSAHWCASLVGSAYDVGLTGVPVGGGRSWAKVSWGPTLRCSVSRLPVAAGAQQAPSKGLALHTGFSISNSDKGSADSGRGRSTQLLPTVAHPSKGLGSVAPSSPRLWDAACRCQGRSSSPLRNFGDSTWIALARHPGWKL